MREINRVGIKYRLNKFLLIISAVMLFVIMVWGTSYYKSARDYRKGELFLAEKNYQRSITFFDRSIHWYTPFNPNVRKSIERLWEIGIDAEKKGDIRLALAAYRTIRGGIYGIQSVYAPYREWIVSCDRKIAQLKDVEQNFVSDKKNPNENVQAKDHTKDSPDVAWSILLEIGFFGWIGSVIALIFSLSGRLENSMLNLSPTTWGIIACTSFFIFIAGMYMA